MRRCPRAFRRNRRWRGRNGSLRRSLLRSLFGVVLISSQIWSRWRVGAECGSRITSITAEQSPVAMVLAWAHIRSMSNAPQIAEVAALIGDPARANILCALLGGRALTATELAFAANVTPQTTSAHLGKLLGARLLILSKQGRHRYYRLAGAHVGQMLEGIMNVALSG